jgi:hypothetical protein
MRLKRIVWFLVLAAVFECGAVAQQPAKNQESEQTGFGAGVPPGEVAIKKPVRIPDAALQVLRDGLGPGTLDCVRNMEGLSAEQVPASWFVGSEIHLNGPDETDLVVQPADMRESPSPNRCLFGAAIPVLGTQEEPQRAV